MKLKSMTTDKRNTPIESSTMPSIDVPELHLEHPVSIKINEACLNGDEDCPCTRVVEKREVNPV